MQYFSKLTCYVYAKLKPKSTKLLKMKDYIELANDQKYIKKIFSIRFKLSKY